MIQVTVYEYSSAESGGDLIGEYLDSVWETSSCGDSIKKRGTFRQVLPDGRVRVFIQRYVTPEEGIEQLARA